MISRVPWLRVLGEGAVIVVSILLGLSIDAWWSGRQAKQLEADIVSALREEVAANRLDLTATREEILRQLDRIERFLGANPAALGALPEDSVAAFVQAMARPLAFSPLNGAATLISESTVLSSDGIRARTLVTEWRTLILDAEDEKGRLAQRASDVQDRLARYAARAGALGGGTFSSRIARLDPSTLVEIQSDPSVVEAVLLKSAIQSVYLSNLESAAGALDALASELGGG